MSRSVLTLGTTAIGLALGLGLSLASPNRGHWRRQLAATPSRTRQRRPGDQEFPPDDGVLTFAIVTHTAGNGFFDPVYVGATVAANLIGAKVLLLGSESPTDDPAREIEILNQIVQDPTLDGLILTTPQVGAYNDIVKTAEQKGIPVATTNSFDGTIYNRSGISHTGQDASAAAIAGEALVPDGEGYRSSSILLPSSTAMGNIEVNNRVTSAFNAIVAKLQEQGKLENFKVDAGPENTGIDTNPNDPVNSIVSLFESRGDVVGALPATMSSPALAKAVAQMGKTGEICAYGFDLGPAQQEVRAPAI